MFNVSEEAVRAEDKYRRNLLRDQNQTSGNVKRAVGVIVIASAMALVLAACGVPVDNDGAAIQAPTQPNSQLETPAAPGWQPNPAITGGGVVIVPEFGGMPAPIGRADTSGFLADYGVFSGPTHQPNQKALQEVLGIDTSVFEGPTHQPDLAKLESILNGSYSTPASGPR